MSEPRHLPADISEVRQTLDEAIVNSLPHAGGRVRSLLKSLQTQLARVDELRHAGVGLPCDQCNGSCRVDTPAAWAVGRMGEPDPFRLLITGSRADATTKQANHIRGALDQVHARVIREWLTRAGQYPAEIRAAHRPLVVVHGDCRTGVDQVAAHWAVAAAGVAVEAHPADWEQYGRRAGPRRNAYMVRLGADLCLAFPGLGSVGTWDCLKKAANAGIPARVWPLARAGRT